MKSLKGQLILDPGKLQGSFFHRTVILVCQHDDEGAFGLVLNRPAPIEELPFPVFVGGPCKMDGLLMIHGMDAWLKQEADAPPEICPGIYLGTTEQFEKIASSAEPASGRFRVFTGYAGWGPKQLEAEMLQDAVRKRRFTRWVVRWIWHICILAYLEVAVWPNPR